MGVFIYIFVGRSPPKTTATIERWTGLARRAHHCFFVCVCFHPKTIKSNGQAITVGNTYCGMNIDKVADIGGNTESFVMKHQKQISCACKSMDRVTCDIARMLVASIGTTILRIGSGFTVPQ